MINNLTMTGRLGRDAKLSYTKNQDPVCNFSAALTSGYGDKAKTSWLECTLFGKRAEVLTPMLLKGTLVGVVGEFSLDTYKANDGTEKMRPECRIVSLSLLSSKSEGGAAKPAKVVDPMDDLESSIPF
jgi:single-strand DNA-binding protein